MRGMYRMGLMASALVLLVPVRAQQNKATAESVWKTSRAQGNRVPLRATLEITLQDEQGKRKTRSRIVRDGKGRTRNEYLEPSGAKGRIMILDGMTHYQYEPSRRLLIKSAFDPTTPEASRAAEQIVPQDYQLLLLPKMQTVAGRACWVLELTPHHGGKGDQTRWIDAKTGATLQIETRYSDGSLASLVRYSDVEFPAQVPASAFAPPNAASVKTLSKPVPESERSPEGMARLAQSLGLQASAPLGFRLRQVVTQTQGKSHARQFLYSDGLFFLSVFVQDGFAENPAARPPWKSVPLGKTVVHELKRPHSNVIVWMKQGRRYSVMSRVSPQALREFIRPML